MSEIWPKDTQNRLIESAVNPIRPFKCLLLMPFEGRFNQVAEIIKNETSNTINYFHRAFNFNLPEIERLDWVTSSGVIQQEIWQKIYEADLIFCDITGYNPNVMFETGVCAAWKDMVNVIFIKDHFFKQQSAFDLAPIRYTEYELTSEGIEKFEKKVHDLLINVLISYPDVQGLKPLIQLPLNIEFQESKDDSRVYTPPFAHRRVIDGKLEFGSINFYSHSWATIGKYIFKNFELKFWTNFSNSMADDAYIGVGLRSQHYYANYSHFLYLRKDGYIIITEPNEKPPKFYIDNQLRPKTKIDSAEDHYFHIIFDDSKLNITIDDFSKEFQIKEMEKVFGEGLIRFQSLKSWMVIKKININEI